MTDPIISDKELRALMSYHFRRTLEDELLQGHLPERLAKAVDESPDEVIELLVQALAPGAAQRMGSLVEASADPPADKILSPEDLKILLSALSSMRNAHRPDVDMDLDGALLFCNRGREMLKKERFADAKRHFERAIAIKDTIPAAWEGLAKAQEELGQADEAAESRKRAAGCRQDTP